MKDDLHEKLDQLLRGKSTFTEAEAVYFLVESRKLIDREREEGNDCFRLLRFYADWSVHTAKGQKLDSIRDIVERIASAPRSEQSVKGVVPERLQSRLDFMNMTALRDDVRDYLRHFSIVNPFEDDSTWADFVAKLTAVLQDQPIVNPHLSIAEIRYERAAAGAAILTVIFRDERGMERYGNHL